MNALRNRVQLIGNLGMDPEVKKFDGNKTMAKFSLATTETYKNAEGKKVDETQWHNIIAWGNLAVIAEKYLSKGREVAVEGKLIHRSYEDKDGNKKYISEIVANEILLLRKNN
ncbi:MAG: single-stranded DNA-binding protein [Bacteroidales bacterium]|nr:single-stranded DNA-binding protein [Bacteroidales bacterium]